MRILPSYDLRFDLHRLIVASNQLLMMYPNHQILIPIRSKVPLSVIEISLQKNGDRYVSLCIPFPSNVDQNGLLMQSPNNIIVMSAIRIPTWLLLIVYKVP